MNKYTLFELFWIFGATFIGSFFIASAFNDAGLPDPEWVFWGFYPMLVLTTAGIIWGSGDQIEGNELR